MLESICTLFPLGPCGHILPAPAYSSALALHWQAAPAWGVSHLCLKALKIKLPPFLTWILIFGGKQFLVRRFAEQRSGNKGGLGVACFSQALIALIISWNQLLREAESPLEYAVRVFQRAYTHDIERLAAVKVGTGNGPWGLNKKE
eukprot:1152881-Pelagomonas_calceolata.AAC.4